MSFADESKIDVKEWLTENGLSQNVCDILEGYRLFLDIKEK